MIQDYWKPETTLSHKYVLKKPTEDREKILIETFIDKLIQDTGIVLSDQQRRYMAEHVQDFFEILLSDDSDCKRYDLEYAVECMR